MGFVIIGGPLLLGLLMWVFGGRRNQLKREVSEQGARENGGKERTR